MLIYKLYKIDCHLLRQLISTHFDKSTHMLFLIREIIFTNFVTTIFY